MHTGRYKEETWEKILILSKDSCMKFLCAYFKAPFIPSTKNFWKIKNTTREGTMLSSTSVMLFPFNPSVRNTVIGIFWSSYIIRWATDKSSRPFVKWRWSYRRRRCFSYMEGRCEKRYQVPILHPVLQLPQVHKENHGNFVENHNDQRRGKKRCH